MTFAAGETIIQQGADSDRFYIITAGHIEVGLHTPDGEDIVVATMGAGEYFGEIELLRGGKTIATIRAANDRAVDVVALDRKTFCALLGESESTRAAISQIADVRIAENIASRGAPIG